MTPIRLLARLRRLPVDLAVCRHGRCYDFALLLHEACLGGALVVHRDEHHYAYRDIRGRIYDADGLIEDASKFRPATRSDHRRAQRALR